MPQLTQQPSTTDPAFHPVGNLDALLWKLKGDTDFIIVAGSQAQVTLEFNGTARAIGGTLTIFGQQYIVYPATTSTTIDLTSGTAQQHANRFAQAVLANVNLFPYVYVTVFQAGSNWRVTVQWKQKMAWSDVYANGTISPALTISSENLGADPVYIEGFHLAYQLFKDDSTGGTPLTDLKSVVPFVVEDVELETEIDFADIADFQVATEKPFNQTLILPSTDDTFTQSLFLRYGSHVTADGETTWGSFADSDTIKIANMALPLGDEMENYHYTGFSDGRVKFLTARPRNSAMPRCGQRAWLWCILDVARYLALDGDTLTNYFVEFSRYTAAGALTFNTASLGTTDRVLIYPIGSDNCPFLLDGFDRYKIRIRANVMIGGSPQVITVTEEMTFHLDLPCQCAEPYREIYFLEPLGGFGTLPIFEVQTVEVNQDYLTHLEEIDPEETAGNKRINGGHSLNSPRSTERITLRVRERYTPDNYNYLKGLRSSSDRYVYFKPEDSETGETYKFIPDPGTMAIYRKDEWVYCELTGRLHYELPVQRQPNLSRL